jgi:hypothetical protein
MWCCFVPQSINTVLVGDKQHIRLSNARTRVAALHCLRLTNIQIYFLVLLASLYKALLGTVLDGSPILFGTPDDLACAKWHHSSVFTQQTLPYLTSQIELHITVFSLNDYRAQMSFS